VIDNNARCPVGGQRRPPHQRRVCTDGPWSWSQKARCRYPPATGT